MEIHITKKDVLWGYIAQFFNIGAGILLLPVILKLLPADILGAKEDHLCGYTAKSYRKD